MIPLLALSLFLYLGSLPQTPTVSLIQDGANLKVSWTASPTHALNEWIGLYQPGVPTTNFPPSTLWKYVPAGGMGELVFENVPPGTWEARYLSGGNADLAKSAVSVTIGMDDPAPLPNLGEQVFYYMMVLPDGQILEGPTTDRGFNIVMRYYNSALGKTGSTSLKVWKLSITRPATPADLELSGVVRNPVD